MENEWDLTQSSFPDELLARGIDAEEEDEGTDMDEGNHQPPPSPRGTKRGSSLQTVDEGDEAAAEEEEEEGEEENVEGLDTMASRVPKKKPRCTDGVGNGSGGGGAGGGGGAALPSRENGAANSINTSSRSRGLKPSRLFGDGAYGRMIMDGLCVEIIDTPQFQRLAGIKQLGVCSEVYRSAVHTRLQHSLGVAYLAEKFIHTLMRAQPALLNNRAKPEGKITRKDILCVKIAGLCHDLGHGPFSHAFEQVVHRANSEAKGWKHEQMSIDLFDALIKENKIDVTNYGLDEEDLVFIKDCIKGTKPRDRSGTRRKGIKSFLYDIVNNERSGLDVDKLDYFQRDAMACLKDIRPGWQDMMENARVMMAEPIEGLDEGNEDEKPWQIVYCSLLKDKAMTWFSTRYKLHDEVYQLGPVKQMELMVCDILLLADPYLKIPGRQGPDGNFLETFRMSETVEKVREGSLTAYCKLKDCILNWIDVYPDPRLQPARDLYMRMKRRDLYRSLGAIALSDKIMKDYGFSPEGQDKGRPGSAASSASSSSVTSSEAASMDGISLNGDHCDERWNIRLAEKIQADIVALIPPEHLQTPNGDELLVVEILILHYGKLEKNPVQQMRFYKVREYRSLKTEERMEYVAKQLEDNKYDDCRTTRKFCSKRVRVFCKDSRRVEVVQAAWDKWCADHNCPLPEEPDGSDDGSDDEAEAAANGGSAGAEGGGGLAS